MHFSAIEALAVGKYVLDDSYVSGLLAVTGVPIVCYVRKVFLPHYSCNLRLVQAPFLYFLQNRQGKCPKEFPTVFRTQGERQPTHVI